MNSMFESTAWRPILWIRRTSILLRSRSVKNSDRPSVLRFTSSSGVVRASSIILFATWATEIQIFSPLTR